MMDNGTILFHKQAYLICVILKCVERHELYAEVPPFFCMVLFVFVLLEVLASRADGVAHFGLLSLMGYAFFRCFFWNPFLTRLLNVSDYY